MHLALLPGLILALVGGVLGTNGAGHAHNLPGPGTFARVQSLYSITAQTATTSTATIIAPTIAAGAATTSTSVISATATVTRTTPVPLPTVGSQGNLRVNPFDWAYLTSAPAPPLGLFAWVYLAVMIALFGVSAYFYFFKRLEWKRTNPVLKRAADRWGPIGMWVSGLALLFVAFRAVSIDFFNLRFWFYLWLLTAIVVIAWMYYWYRTTYPRQLAKYQKTQRARQYMPSAKKKGAARPVAPPPSGGASVPVAPSGPQAGKKRRRR